MDNLSRMKTRVSNTSSKSCFYQPTGESLLNASRRKRVTDSSQRTYNTHNIEDEDEDEERCVSGGITPYNFRPATWNTVHDPTVVVNFYNPVDEDYPAYEVWLHDAELIVHRQETSGGIRYSTRLTKLLPAAVRNNYPMREKGGHIHRPGIASSHSLIYVGSIPQIAYDNCHHSLKLPALDEIFLEPLDSGIYACSLYWEHFEEKTVEYDNLPDDCPSPGHTSPLPLPIASRFDVPGDYLDQTVDRTKFIDYLRYVLGIPHNKEWPRAEYISDVLDRYLEVSAGIKKLKSWGRKGSCKGGYQVPLTDKSEFRGVTFTQAAIFEAFSIGPSKYSGDKNHFTTKNLAKSPIARAWVENPNGEHRSLFAKMSIPDFTRFINNGTEENSDATLHRKRKANSDCGDDIPRLRKKINEVEEK